MHFNLICIHSIFTDIRRRFSGPRLEVNPSQLSVSKRQLVFAHEESGRDLLRAARCLHESGQFVPALTLYREAIVAYSKATLLVESPDPEPALASPSVAVGQMCDWLDARAPATAARLRQGLSGILDFSDLEIDRLPRHDTQSRAMELDAAGRQLEAMVVVKTRPYRQFWPLLSIAVMLSIAGVYWVARPKNIALGKTVTAHAALWDGRLQGVVDGKQTGVYDFHSLPHAEPWLTIDLVQRYAIARAEVYGRHDCCFDQSVPLAFEVSDDGVTYRAIETRTDAFIPLESWTIEPRNVAARFVSLRTLRASPLVISEVEIYGTVVR